MTTLLAKAFAEAVKLSPEDQDAFARWMLDELEDEARWSNSFAKSLDVLERLGNEALEELHAGKTKRLIGCGG